MEEPDNSKPSDWKTLVSLEHVSTLRLYSILYPCLSHPLCLVTAALSPTMAPSSSSSHLSFAKYHTSVSCFPPFYLFSKGKGRAGKPSRLLFPPFSSSVPEKKCSVCLREHSWYASVQIQPGWQKNSALKDITSHWEIINSLGSEHVKYWTWLYNYTSIHRHHIPSKGTVYDFVHYEGPELTLILDADPKHHVITHTTKIHRAFPMSKKNKLKGRKRSAKYKGDFVGFECQTPTGSSEIPSLKK